VAGLDPDQAAGLAGERPVLGRGRPEHRGERLGVGRPAGNAPFAIDVHDQRLMAALVVVRRRPEVRREAGERPSAPLLYG
jgi:hypothetical protein